MNKEIVSKTIDRNNKIKLAPVSVIIPCYNCQDTIERAVESVVNQTQKPKELILVNDGSTDNTLAILHDLQNRFGEDWVKIINFSENKGPSRARNVGWDSATGDYIAFLDADDSWHPQKIEIQYNCMSRFSDVVLTSHKYVLMKDNMDILNHLPQQWKVKPVSKLELMLISRYFSTPTVMVKSNVPYRFPNDFRYSEDRFLWLEIVARKNKAFYLDIPLTYLYKAPYGQGGLTQNLYNTEKGELAGFTKLYNLKLLNRTEFLLSYVFSLIKYVRRKCIVLSRKIFGKVRGCNTKK